MEYVRLGEYCTITSSKRIFAHQYVANGIPFYRSKEIIEKNNNEIVSDPLFISVDVYNIIKEKFGVPKFGDILLTSVGTLGVPYLVKDETFYFKDGNLTWLKDFDNRVSSKYIYYWLSSSFGKASLLQRAIGSSQPAITIEILKNYKILLPNISDQCRIASILSAYDNLIENNNRRIRLLEQMAENLYKEWFVRFRFPGHEKAEFENGLPKGWRIEKYVNVAKINAGGDKPDYYSQIPTEECSVPVYSNGIVDDGLYGYTNKPKIKKPCITISARGTVGFVCLRRIPFVPIVRLLSVVPNDIINVYYLYHSSIYNDLEGNGTSQQQLTVPMLNKRKILVPSKDTLELFSKNVEPLYDQIDLLKKQSANLSRQRDLLLPRLMSGKLEVKV